MTALTTGLVDRLLKKRNLMAGIAGKLEDAGLKLMPAEFVVVSSAGTLLAVCIGLILSGPLSAAMLGLSVPLLVKLGLGLLVTRRRKQFADQLDDTLQLLAGGLRAGHSLLRAIDAVATDSEAPTSVEFTRIINETRLGRDLGESLDDAAARMQSEDFSWVAQAIAIHREVGGNLATVLDQVGQTIRERNQIRRQVQALSAEGKLSAYILMALPFALGGVLLVISPGYMNPLFQHPIGYILMSVSVVLLVVGGLWLRKVITFKF
ncbi:type II secretion system F family protein [Arthrobacter sp. CAN_A1]|uniref:type II secretion system F family protein n=1 Tax=Arthrobacter sp. CAN_A1 TaxID=2787717 RepID=UPI001A338D13